MAEAGFALAKTPVRVAYPMRYVPARATQASAKSALSQRDEAADDHLRRWRSSTIRRGIACVAPPCNWSSGALTIVKIFLLHNTGMRLVLQIVLTYCGAVSVLADTLPSSRFEWKQPIAGRTAVSNLYRVAVPPEIYDGCRSFPADIRIFTDDGIEWPFYLWEPSGETESYNVPAHPGEPTLVEEGGRCTMQDLQVLPDEQTGKRVEHNQVIVRTSGRDFVRRVEVFGGENPSTWSRLGSGCLVDHSRDIQVSRNTVDYPATTAPFVRVKVFPNLRDASESVTIQSVALARNVEQPAERIDVPVKEIPAPAGDTNADAQVLIFDTGARSRPVERLVITARESRYARAVKVAGRNDDSASWRWVADGEIHHVDGSAQDVVPLKGSYFRFLRVEIYHHEDKPLNGVDIHAQAVPQYLVLEAEGGEKPALYYGSLAAALPRYDLHRRKGDKLAVAAPSVRLGDRKSNLAPQVTEARGPRTRVGIMAAVVACGAVLALMMGLRRRVQKRTSRSG